MPMDKVVIALVEESDTGRVWTVQGGGVLPGGAHGWLRGFYKLDQPNVHTMWFDDRVRALAYIREHGGECLAGEALPEKPEVRRRGDMKHGPWTFRSRPDIPEDQFRFLTNIRETTHDETAAVSITWALRKYSQRGEIDIRLPARSTTGRELANDVAIFLREAEKPEETWPQWCEAQRHPAWHYCGWCLYSFNESKKRCPGCGAKLAPPQRWDPKPLPNKDC